MNELLNYFGPGLAIWLSWIWVAIGQWILAKKSMEVMGKNPKMMTFFLTITILGLALVESAAIYWLVVAFQLLDSQTIGLGSSIWAGASIWLTGLGAWIWEGLLIAWALWAMNRNPSAKLKIMAFMVLFVALIEVVAIYGLIVSFQIINSWIESFAYIGAWLAIWLAWLGVAVGQWLLSSKSLETMWVNPKLMTFFLTITILGMALVESAAIYGLIVSFSILASETIALYAAIGAGCAIWFAWLWAWIWEGTLIRGAISAMNTSPESKYKIMAFMVLFVALVEVVAIYGLIIAYTILG